LEHILQVELAAACACLGQNFSQGLVRRNGGGGGNGVSCRGSGGLGGGGSGGGEASAGGGRPLELGLLLLETAHTIYECICAGGCAEEEEDGERYGKQAQGMSLVVAGDV
jgi:hypothetical protein